MNTIPYLTAQRRLLTTWLSGGLVLLLCMLLLTINDDSQHMRALWAWFLPWVVPTASVMVAVVVAEQTGRATVVREIDRPLFQLVWVCAMAYLLLLFATLFALILGWMELEMTSIFLTPVQAIVTGLTGIFFVQKDASTQRNRRSGDHSAAPVAGNSPQPGGH